MVVKPVLLRPVEQRPPIVIVTPPSNDDSKQMPPVSKSTSFEAPERPPKPESKKDFEIEPESKINFEPSKKDFEPEQEFEDEIEIDREGDIGRWRKDSQVAELVIYRHEWTVWPSDVPTETGLRSYYELRYFDEGANRKGVKYSELYAKHRAKRDLWIRQYQQSGSIEESDLDTPTTESNVVHFPDRWASGSN